MSSLAEYRSWLVVEAAEGFGAATVAAKLLADLGCTVAKLELPPSATAAGNHGGVAASAVDENPEAAVAALAGESGAAR